MVKSFDVRIESLVSDGTRAPAEHQPVGRPGASVGLLPLPLRAARGAALGDETSGGDAAVAGSAVGKSFFLETFGCQMNDHDSEKVAGVLQGRGYRAVDSPAQADLVLYNTCSIREKAAQKVFARLGDWKTLADGKIIGVLGCLAQQEGEEIFERAPWVSLVCGSASYRKLPELIAQLESGGRRVTGPGSGYQTRRLRPKSRGATICCGLTSLL